MEEQKNNYKIGKIVKNVAYGIIGTGLVLFGGKKAYDINQESKQIKNQFNNARLLESEAQSLNATDLAGILKQEGISNSQYQNMFEAIRKNNPGIVTIVNYGNGVPKDGFVAKNELKYLANHGKNIQLPDFNADGMVYMGREKK